MSRRATGIVIVLLVLATACARNRTREFELRGQVLAIDRARQEVTIKHEDIPRFMPGMTMAFKVADRRLLEGRVAGDLIKATLVVRDTDVHLRTLDRTGFAPLQDPLAIPPQPLQSGEQVSDTTFVDESGTTRRLADWRGHVLGVTFIYTQCPLPNFCPVMDRQFKTVQDAIRNDAGLTSSVRLLSVSFDPVRDTPRVLSEHAAKLGADPALWRFLTGTPEEVDRFASQFGVSIARDKAADSEIVHNLRTAIIDSDGRLVTILTGSDWTPADLLNALRRSGETSGTR